jgi:hypothetical protein
MDDEDGRTKVGREEDDRLNLEGVMRLCLPTSQSLARLGLLPGTAICQVHFMDNRFVGYACYSDGIAVVSEAQFASLAPHSSNPILSPSPLLFPSIDLEAVCPEMWNKPSFGAALFEREGSPRLRICSKSLCAR